MAKKKKGLIDQLKSLVGLEKEPELMGAMCYETHMPSFVTLKCEQCGMEKEYDQFLMTEDEEIIEIVKTSTSELCQIFNCPALLTQCKRIQGTWNGLK